jgi:hypothetical protein
MSENESKTAAFTIPAFDYENATPEQANAELNRLNAEFGSSLDRHPLAQSTHFQRGDFIKHRERVMDVVRRGMDTRSIPEQVLQGVYDRGQAKLAEKRGELIAEAKKEVELLEGLGFDPTEIPDDIQEYQLNALRMQRLNAEGNFMELFPLLQKELTTLRAKGMNTFHFFVNDESLSPAERSEHIELILKRIYAANTEKAEKEQNL